MAPHTETEKSTTDTALEPVNRNVPERSEETFPWERLPNESPQAYRAFTLYRTMDAKTRSFAKLAPLCSHTLAVRWAARFRWVTRTAEWEAWTVLNQAELSEAGRLRFRADSLDFARVALNKAKRSAAQLNETKASVGDVVALAELATKTGRVALDLPPDGPVRASAPDSTGLSVSFGSAVPWLAAFAPSGAKPSEVLGNGEKVLDETPGVSGRKRLVHRIADSQPDNVLAADSASREAERAKPPQIPIEETIKIAPPDPVKPYRRCKKHGNQCRRGGHN